MSRTDLERELRRLGRVAVAVSGGVDSMTLAALAHRLDGVEAEMFHALSPAVPPQATARVRTLAEREGWSLRVLDAGEFEDPEYLANPVNRCFFCKSNLYGAIAPLTEARLVSGTNLDDLGDYRPGLEAAANSDVEHPFVRARVAKAGVRVLARELGLSDLSVLPSAPCLSSRIETGIRIDPRALTVVDEVEVDLRERLHPDVVRCRVTAGRIVVELDNLTLDQLSPEAVSDICRNVATRWQRRGRDLPVEVRPYRRGSAFLRQT